jgi:hypothetical protein
MQRGEILIHSCEIDSIDAFNAKTLEGQVFFLIHEWKILKNFSSHFRFCVLINFALLWNYHQYNNITVVDVDETKKKKHNHVAKN